MANAAENIAAAEASAKSNPDAKIRMTGILTAIRAEVAALKASGTDAATATRIDALVAELDARKPSLAAVAAGN